MTVESSRSSVAALAKAALRRLAQAQSEPTPENYARAYAEASGQPVAPAVDTQSTAAAWAQLVERLARNLQRGGRQWTAARRRGSLQRVLDGSRSDANRLQQRLLSLMTAWESDQALEEGSASVEDTAQTAVTAVTEVTEATEATAATATPPAAGSAGHWPRLVATLEATVRVALPTHEPRAAELAQQLATLADAVAIDGASADHVAAISALCEQARRLLGQGHRQVEHLVRLCRELTEGMVELSEDRSEEHTSELQSQ